MKAHCRHAGQPSQSMVPDFPAGCDDEVQETREDLVWTLDRLGLRVYLTLWLFNRKVYFCMVPDRLSTTFAALADPTRRAILARLTLGETSVMELAEPFAMS